jgi:hypothetical protein
LREEFVAGWIGRIGLSLTLLSIIYSGLCFLYGMLPGIRNKGELGIGFV